VKETTDWSCIMPVEPLKKSFRRPTRLLACVLSALVLVITPLLLMPGAGVSASVLPRRYVEPASTDSLGLLSFGARQKKKMVVIEWETGSELAIVGFNVWRRRGASGPHALNEGMILAQNPGDVLGSAYLLKDRAVSPGKTYYYQLEVIGAGGETFLSEEVKVKVK
jgi:hypothetical protein